MGAEADDPSSSSVLSREERRKAKERKADDRAIRRARWTERYGSAEALRRTFGGAPTTRWWGGGGGGDLSPAATRRLYHTLLPRSLLGLHELKLMDPSELAPLAYQARAAAKEYARSRCTRPGRLLAEAFDAYRSWRRHGTLQPKGLSWEQLWDKYEAQIVEEECAHELKGQKIDEDALATRIYMRILERSCATNEAFDRMFLQPANDGSGSGKNEDDTAAEELTGDLDSIAARLERDVREILLEPKLAKKAEKRIQKAEKERAKIETKAEQAAAKAEAKAHKAERDRREDERKERRRRLVKQRKKKREEEEEEKEEKENPTLTVLSEGEVEAERESDERRRRAYSVLQILARTRQNFGRS